MDAPANSDTIETALSDARDAARSWRGTTTGLRARLAYRVRRLIAARAGELAESVGPIRPLAETLSAEILPLAEAAAFLARRAPALLAPRRLGWRGRPIWLFGVDAELRREPCGVVLILGPSNYPLFLPAVQALQALVAGNAVCVKPAPGCSAPMDRFADLLAEADLPPGLLQILPDDTATGVAAAAAPFDRIVLTGSAATGRAVLRAAAENLVPSTMELSGNDAVFVLPGADLARVAAALAYGVSLNGGATCIAPRRVFLPSDMMDPLAEALRTRLAAWPEQNRPRNSRAAARLAELAAAAIAGGARRIPAPDGRTSPLLLAGANPDMELLREDVFAPWLAFVPVRDAEAALAAAERCPYALGAAIFGPESTARAFAGRVRAGSVCINDVIVPTADPRLPFGGRGQSGFGVTRGAAGLLEMTVVKTVSCRRFGPSPHLSPNAAMNAPGLLKLIRILHGKRLGR